MMQQGYVMGAPQMMAPQQGYMMGAPQMMAAFSPYQAGWHPQNPTAYALFIAVDADRSGSISFNELQTALSNGGWTKFSAKTTCVCQSGRSCVCLARNFRELEES